MQSNNDERSFLQPNENRSLIFNAELNISANNEESVGIRANETSSNILEIISNLNSVTRNVSVNN